MKKYLLLLVLSYAFLSAQNQRFTYEYSFVSDSTNKTKVEKELLILDVIPTGSQFYSYAKFKDDSLSVVELKRQANSGSETVDVSLSYTGKIDYTVAKKYPTFETVMHIHILQDDYRVLEDRKMIWKISAEKQKIGELESQKAETTLYGRKWTAWFTSEIPIQDGPYKFHGLPGLIVKIQDQSKTHSYELKGIAKYVDNNKSQIDEEFNYENEIPISYLQYKKLFLEQRNDPTKSLRELLNKSGTTLKMFGPVGNEIKPSEILRERELKGKENRKKNNNPLELDLLQ